MAVPTKGVKLAAPAVPLAPGTYPTHHSNLGQGGYMQVATDAERTQISSLRYEAGMLCYVVATDTYWQLNSQLQWELANLVGETARLYETITQSGHGFALLDAIYYEANPVTGSPGWTHADAGSEATLATGIVTKVNGDDFEVTYEGMFRWPNHGYSLGSWWLGNSKDGKSTQTKPTAVGTYRQCSYTVIDSSGIYVESQAIAYIGDTVSGGNPITVAVSDITPVSDGAFLGRPSGSGSGACQELTLGSGLDSSTGVLILTEIDGGTW